MVDLDKYRKSIYRILGDAYDVYNEYNGGLLESVYEAAFCYVLSSDGFHVERQKGLPIFYKGIKLDQTFRMDIVLNNQIILELKSAEAITKEFRFQLFNYLRLTHMPIGMLINFSINKGVQSEKYYYNEVKNECIPF